jgi:ribonuclease D
MEERSFMPCKADAASINWVDSDAGLREATAAWAPHKVIAIDTEFQRTDTFFPLPGLYQVAAGGQIYLIDPLEITQWQPFVACLSDSSVTKVMHACSEDLELINHHLGIVPESIFDTQLAYAFQSPQYSASYARLVAGLLDVELGKHETRSNWLQRPLSDRQLQYAREDVYHLETLHARLVAGLQELGREAWFADLMTDRADYARGRPEEYYRNVKNAWKLDGVELGRLRGLCAWRERRAMTEDVPRNRVVWDDHLLRFARAEALTEDVVTEALPRAVARRYASDIVREHSELVGRNDSLAALARPLTQAQAQVSKALREIARACADGLELAHELVARKRDVDACIRHFLDTGELSPAYSGWRHELLGGQFHAVLRDRL